MRRETKAKARRREREARATNMAYETEEAGTRAIVRSPLLASRVRSWLGSVLGPGGDPPPVRVKPGPPIPAAPAPKTPVDATHEDSAVAHRFLAIVAGIDTSAARRRGRLLARQRRSEAALGYREWRAKRAQSAEDAASQNVTAYEDKAVKPEHRYKLEPRRGMHRLIPWALVLADTMIMQRAWTLWGGSFTKSKLEPVLLSYLRAFVIAFALVWSLRVAGSKLRHAIAEVAGRRGEKFAHAFAIVVAGVAVFGAYLLAGAASKLQGVLFSILGGGTSTTIGDGTFRSIVFFLIITSFAAGYFSAAPEADDAERIRQPLRKARRANRRHQRLVARADGRVEAMKERVTAFEKRVEARKREQIHVGLEEIAKGQGARHELVGIEAHDHPLEVLHAQLELLGETPSRQEQATNGFGPGSQKHRREQVRKAVDDRKRPTNGNGSHA